MWRIYVRFFRKPPLCPGKTLTGSLELTRDAMFICPLEAPGMLFADVECADMSHVDKNEC